MLTAAAVNAMAANVQDFDDTHIPTIVHPTVTIAAALFALAETRVVTGEQLLHAFAVGVEVECRIANAISPSHYARGWHITTTAGIFGVAAAAAKVLGLNEQQVLWAFGNASVQSSGLVESLGTSAKSMGVGNCARNGLLSALLAQAGFEGPTEPLEGRFGWLKVVCDDIRWDALQGDPSPNKRWQLQNNTYKPYPCGVILNPVIDACLDLAVSNDFTDRGPDAITRVEITGHPLLRQRTDRPGVTSGRLSQVSAQHAVGVALTRARAGLAEFSDEATNDPRVRALGAKVVFHDDTGVSVEGARVSIAFADGHALTKDIAAARSSLANPLTDQDLSKKLIELARFGGSNVSPQPLLNTLWALELSANVASVVKLATPAPTPHV